LETHGEIADYWELRQRDRRYIIQLASYMNWFLDARLPYLDNDVVEFALNLPLEYRIGKKFIHSACQRLMPELTGIAWEKTGVPPNTQGIGLKLAWVKRVGLQRIKGIVEYLSQGRILFRPQDYRAYGYWLRRDSQAFVENLLNPRLSSGIFDTGKVVRIVGDHMRARRNHDQLICDIINLVLFEKTMIPRIEA